MRSSRSPVRRHVTTIEPLPAQAPASGPVPATPWAASAPSPPPRLDALTPLRFLAAAMIIFGHGSPVFGHMPGSALLFAANAAVSFFFVLSGFVLAYNYPVLRDRAAVGRFCALRFARIWPLHAIALLAIIVLFPVATTVQAGIDPRLAALLSFALLQSWVPVNGYAAAYNGPAWTLSVDVFFYAMFPMLLVRVREAPWRSLAGALLLSVMPPLFANAFGPARSDIPLDRWNWYMLDHFFPLARLVEFVLGMAAAHAFVQLRSRLPTRAIAATFLEIGAIAICAAAIAAFPLVPYAALWVGAGVADWLTQVAAAPAFALLAIALAPGRGGVSRVLSTRVAVHLGDLSYASYLLHVPVLHAFLSWQLVAAIGTVPAALAFVAALLALAHLAWRFIELPARFGIIRWFDRRLATRARTGRGDQAGAPTS